MKIHIAYENTDIIIAEKPRNVPSQPDPSGDLDMVQLVKNYLAEKNNITDPYVALHHRLDRHVGGLMAFGKTKQGNQLLSQQIQNHDIEKQYLVVVCGKPEKSHGTLENYLKKLGNRNVSKVVSSTTHGAKKARLQYELLETIQVEQETTLSLLRIYLETGRHHQIRVQLSYAGLPVLGDSKYNKKRIPSLSTLPLSLWAYSLKLQNADHEIIRFECIPHDHPSFEYFQWIQKQAR